TPREQDAPQRTRRRKCCPRKNLPFAGKLFLARPLRHRPRPRDKKRQPIGAAYPFRRPSRAPPRPSTHSVLRPLAVVPLATIKCSSAIDEKAVRKRTSQMFPTARPSRKRNFDGVLKGTSLMFPTPRCQQFERVSGTRIARARCHARGRRSARPMVCVARSGHGTGLNSNTSEPTVLHSRR